jgi:cardiolipin synthase
MNIPNLLTLIRIILVPVIVILLIQASFFKAMIVFVIAGITDGLDGFLARVLNQKTVLGAYLDPLADKALILTSFVTLSVMGVVPSWLSVIVISRDLIILVGISVLVLMGIPFEVKPTFVSKVTTTLQLLTVFMVMVFLSLSINFDLHAVDDMIYWLTALFTIASGFSYIVIGLRMINSTSPAERH